MTLRGKTRRCNTPLPTLPPQGGKEQIRSGRGKPANNKEVLALRHEATIDSLDMTKKPKQPETKKPAPPEPKPRRYGMVALAAEVPAIAKQALGKRGFAEAGLFTHWPEIAGAALAASSLPIKLSFPQGRREDGTLTVRCGGSAALELQHLSPSVLERVNGHFGYRAVARLKIEQGDVARTQGRLGPPGALPPLTALEKGEIEQSVQAVENAEIRATLTRLGSAIRRREKSPDKA